MNQLLKNCKFDFSKSSETLKATVLAVCATAAMTFATPSSAHDHDHASQLSGWQTYVDMQTPNAAGKSYLDKLEDAGKLKTPITFADYKQIVLDFDHDGDSTFVRNPLTKSGVIAITAAKMYEKQSGLKATVDSFVHAVTPTTAKEDFAEQLNQYDLIRLNSKPIIQDVKRNIDVVFSGLNNPNVYDETGATKLRGSFKDKLSRVTYKAPTSGMNHGSNFIVEGDGGEKIKVGHITLPLGRTHIYGDAADIYISKAGDDSLNKEYYKIGTDHDTRTKLYDVEKFSHLSQDERNRIDDTTTLIHEMGHAFRTATFNNSEMLTHVYDTIDHIYGESEYAMSLGNANREIHGKFRLFDESHADMFSLAIAALGANDAEWEYAKYSAVKIRKLDYIGYERFDSDLSDVNIDFKGLVREGNVVGASVHDQSAFILGWIDALNDAREGKNPELLKISKDPIKLTVAIFDTYANAAAGLKEVTSDFGAMPAERYTEFVDLGRELTHKRAGSEQLAQMLDKIDVSSFHYDTVNSKVDAKDELASEIQIFEDIINSRAEVSEPAPDVSEPAPDVSAPSQIDTAFNYNIDLNNPVIVVSADQDKVDKPSQTRSRFRM